MAAIALAADARAQAALESRTKKMIVMIDADSGCIGAGIIFSATGGRLQILTAAHVVSEAGPKLTARLVGSAAPFPVTVLKRLDEPEIDLAVIEISPDASTFSAYGPRDFELAADPRTMTVHQPVVMLGCGGRISWNPTFNAQVDSSELSGRITFKDGRVLEGQSGGALATTLGWKIVGMIQGQESDEFTGRALSLERALQLIRDWGFEPQLRSSLADSPSIVRVQVAQCETGGSADLTGFFVAGRAGIVTALHGVAGCSQIRSPDVEREDSELEIHRVDIARDLAWLTTQDTDGTRPQSPPDAPELGAAPDAGSMLQAVGYQTVRPVELRSGSVRIRDRISSPAIDELETRNSPNVETAMIAVQGRVYEGGPIFDPATRRVVGLGLRDFDENTGVAWGAKIENASWERPPLRSLPWLRLTARKFPERPQTKSLNFHLALSVGGVMAGSDKRVTAWPRSASTSEARIPAPQFRLGIFTRKWMTDRLPIGQMWVSLGAALEYESRLRTGTRIQANASFSEQVWQPVLTLMPVLGLRFEPSPSVAFTIDPGVQLPFVTEGSDKKFGLSVAPSLEFAYRFTSVFGRPLWATVGTSIVAFTTLTVPDPLGEAPQTETPFQDHTFSLRFGVQLGL